MKAKNIVIRVISALGIVLLILFAVMEYRESGRLDHILNALLALIPLISLFIATFLSKLDKLCTREETEDIFLSFLSDRLPELSHFSDLQFQ